MTSDEDEWLEGKMRELLEREVFNPYSGADLLKEAIRKVSKRLGHRHVGADIIAAVLPSTGCLSDRVIAENFQSKTGFVFSNDKQQTSKCPDGGRSRARFFRFVEGRDSGTYDFPCVAAPGFAHCGVLSPKRNRIGITIEAHFLNDHAGRVTAITGIRTIRPGRERKRRKPKKK